MRNAGELISKLEEQSGVNTFAPKHQVLSVNDAIHSAYETDSTFDLNIVAEGAD